MMTSTMPLTSQKLMSQDNLVPNGFKEIQSKKEALTRLETTLKKRVNELKELCLKEGELTGFLPVDYPLQPREPIPQIRRRINSDLATKSSTNKSVGTNSNDVNSSIAPPVRLRRQHQLLLQQQQQQQQQRYLGGGHQATANFAITTSNDTSNIAHHNLPFPSRPTSTNSTSSSNSTASSNTRTTISSSTSAFPTHNHLVLSQNHSHLLGSQRQQQQPPPRQHYHNNHHRSVSSNVVAPAKPLQHFSMNGVVDFQPYYEETKPFQMSDFYKYSAKHRQKVDDILRAPAPPPPLPPVTKVKTTRQLQDDVSKKNSLKFSSCDDQIQASVKLIEKSGQKLIEATAKAIAGNPGLAEKFNNILPTNG